MATPNKQLKDSKVLLKSAKISCFQNFRFTFQCMLVECNVGCNYIE